MSEVEIAPVARRRGRRIAIGAVLVSMLAVAGVGVVVASQRWGGTGGAGAGESVASCPSTFATVRETRRATADADRLLPGAEPVGVTVCAYGGAAGVAAALGGPSDPDSATSSTQVTTTSTPESSGPVEADLGLTETRWLRSAAASTVALLASLRAPAQEVTTAAACVVAASVPAATVVGVAYPDRTIWLTVSNCGDVSNGAATVQVREFHALLSAALADPANADPAVASAPADPAAPPLGASPGAVASTGIEPGTAEPGTPEPATLPPDTGVAQTGAPDVTPAGVGDEVPPATSTASPAVTCPSPGGRQNAGSAAVPFPPVAVDVCLEPFSFDAEQVGATVEGTAARQLAATVNALPATPDDPERACPAIGGPVWALTFRGAADQSVTLRADAGGCGDVTDGERSWDADDALFAQIRSLVPGAS